MPSPVWPAPEKAMPPVPAQTVRMAAGHQMLWMAALANVPLPMAIMSAPLPQAAPAPAPFFAGRDRAGDADRWSADGWLHLRRDGRAGLATGAAPATYGASQAGAVLRYRLAPQSAARPVAYLRTSAALGRVREREIAAGVSARPFGELPVIAAAELRVSEHAGEQRVRPALLAVTQVPPFDLPLEARGEIHAQAGYVGGKAATLFADGQIRIDRQVAAMGMAEVRAGGGSWAGAQEGAWRIDAGPGASVRVPLGASGAARLDVDWRLRVAGNAEPESGPAVTLSAGF